MPEDLSKDSFDRETGDPLYKGRDQSYRGTPAGWERNAAHINAPGPR